MSKASELREEYKTASNKRRLEIIREAAFLMDDRKPTLQELRENVIRARKLAIKKEALQKK